MGPELNAAQESLIEYALSLPETREDHPWGERVAKVGKKVFVFFGVNQPDDPRLLVCVKLPHSSLRALDLEYCEPAGYGMGKHGWVAAILRPGDRIDQPLLRGWILESYRAIAPKKLVKSLDARAGAPAASAREHAKPAKRMPRAKPAKPVRRPTRAKPAKPQTARARRKVAARPRAR